MKPEVAAPFARFSTDSWLDTGLETYTLSEHWYIRPVEQFRQGFYFYDEDDWRTTTVPAHWQQEPALAQHTGKVVYRCHFPQPFVKLADSAQQRVWLRMNGAFYWSEPYVNGTSLGRHEGYAIPYEREITLLLHPENTLLVEVDCPDEKNKMNKQILTGIFSHWDCFDPTANPGGIWLPVRLHLSGPVRLQNVRCHTETFNERVAQLRYTVHLDSSIAGPVRLRWTFRPHNFAGEPQLFEQTRTVRRGNQEVAGLFKLYEPQLWWTHDLGAPNLYDVHLEVLPPSGSVSDQASFRFGVRRFELRNWIPHLNGVRLLVKGNNYPSGDMRIATMNYDRCVADLHLAREAHMNLLRIHAHVDHPALYYAADEMGLLLWQDMPLQWLYRQSILPEARRQVRSIVRTLYNHPSVVIWCMHNEPLLINDTNDETIGARVRVYGSSFGFSWNRDVLDSNLKRTAEREDPWRPVIRSSGEFAIPLVRPATDIHMYFGWYETYGKLAQAENVFRFARNNLKFVTEFGAQSLPNIESCARFMPTDIEQIDFAYLAERHSFQSDIMSRWIDWRAAASLDELIQLSQDYQIYINRYYIDRLRYAKYRPTGGIVAFVFLDPYPAILWSVLDYWRVPKRSYHALRMAYNPQYAFTILEPRPYKVAESIVIPVYVVNDAHETVQNARLTIRLCNPADETIATVEHVLELAADCLAWEADRLRFTPSAPGCYILHIALTHVEPPTRQAYMIEVSS